MVPFDAILPGGSTIPPLPYVLAVVGGLLVVVLGLRRAGVSFTDRTILALTPWMVTGAFAYVVFQLDVLPPVVAPLFGSPTVYATTGVVAGLTWLFATRTTRPLRNLALTGGVVVFALIVVALALGAADGLAPVVPLLSVVVATVLTWVTWRLYRVFRPGDVTGVGLAGPVVIFGHALDGVTTAAGIDVLGFAERTPLSRLVMDAAGALPTADLIGVGWLFVLVKLALAAVVLSLLADYAREDPGEGYGLLAIVAAVGLGPGAHNVLLFTLTAPTGF